MQEKAEAGRSYGGGGEGRGGGGGEVGEIEEGVTPPRRKEGECYKYATELHGLPGACEKSRSLPCLHDG